MSPSPLGPLFRADVHLGVCVLQRSTGVCVLPPAMNRGRRFRLSAAEGRPPSAGTASSPGAACLASTFASARPDARTVDAPFSSLSLAGRRVELFSASIRSHRT